MSFVPRGARHAITLAIRFSDERYKSMPKAYGGKKADSKLVKSMVISSVVEWVRKLSLDGGFVKQCNGVWYEIGEYLAREKVGQALREKNHSQYKFSTKAKRRQCWKKEKEDNIWNEDEEQMHDAIRSTQ
jgi:hypothetical protein